jgi:hypothetical protein
VGWTYYWDDNAGGTFFQSGTFTVEANPIVQAGNPSGAGLENQYNIVRLVNQSGTYYLELRNTFQNYAVKMLPLRAIHTSHCHCRMDMPFRTVVFLR